MTTETLGLVGLERAITADYDTDSVEVFDVRNGIWAAVNDRT